jgi:hypothetical protein
MIVAKNIDWEKLYANADPSAFSVATPNGTARWAGTGWNKTWDSDYNRPQLPPDPTRPAGRSNRTGE